MSDGKLETVEPDPAATSLPNDETVNKNGGSDVKVDAGEEAKPGEATSSKVETSDDAPAKEDIAKDTTVETEGNTANGQEGKDQKTESPQKRRREDDDRRGGRGPFKKVKRGNQFDPTVQDITDDPFAIRKQVEFYFSDSNLARDKFLFEKVGGSKNNPVEIKTIHSFKRMRRFQPYEAVIKALKESDQLEVTDDEMLKRKTPLPTGFENKTLEEITKVVEDEAMSRSVYVKNFGPEKPSTQFDIEAWFANFGSTNQVRLRRLDDKTFKGSVFVEFDSEETAKKFLALDPKPKYSDRDMIIMSKKQYCDEKVQAIKDGIIQPDGNGGYRRTDRERKEDTRDWRERREEDRRNGFRGGRGGRGGRGKSRGGRGGYDRRGRDTDTQNEAEGGDSTKDGDQAAEANVGEDTKEPPNAAEKPEAGVETEAGA